MTVVEGADGIHAMELIVRLAPGDAGEAGLRVFCSPDGESYAEIVYSAEDGLLSMHRSRAGAGDGGVSTAPLCMRKDGTGNGCSGFGRGRFRRISWPDT